MRLFNKNFFRFTLGFLSILLMSFAVAAIVAHVDNSSQSASATFGE